MLGIAFGSDDAKQALGDVLVSKKVFTYEPAKVVEGPDGKSFRIPRGELTEAGMILSNRFTEFAARWPGQHKVRPGTVLSGSKLVKSAEFRMALLQECPEAIGGEMEGGGLSAAAQREKVEWILVKGICDWADKNKEDKYQVLAAKNAVSDAEFVLSHPNVLSGL